MNKFMFNLSKTSVTATLALAWTLASLLIFTQIFKVDNQIVEKVYSIDMLIMGYYLNKSRNEKTDTK